MLLSVGRQFPTGLLHFCLSCELKHHVAIGFRLPFPGCVVNSLVSLVSRITLVNDPLCSQVQAGWLIAHYKRYLTNDEIKFIFYGKTRKI